MLKNKFWLHFKTVFNYVQSSQKKFGRVVTLQKLDTKKLSLEIFRQKFADLANFSNKNLFKKNPKTVYR